MLESFIYGGAVMSKLRMSGNSRTRPLNVDIASHDVAKLFKMNIKVDIARSRERNQQQKAFSDWRR